MEDEKFRVLFNTLKSMENDDLAHSEIENSISKVIDEFEKEFTEEQREKILHDFFRYGKIKNNEEKKKKIIEDENYNLSLSASGKEFGY
ncbi:MAG: hypothetical protein V1900_03605 [Candidatus Aenigmatarchaeota archaeon]